jgi:ribosome recycling factor
MQEDIDFAIEAAQEAMGGALAHLERGLSKIRAGKAAPDMIDGLTIEYYGAQTAIKNVATVSTADARTLTIQPFEKKDLPAIERAIFASNMGITPQNDGIIIRLTIPPLTEERRKTMARQGKDEGEHAKVGVRAARREAIEDIKKAVKNGYPEDAGKRAEERVQKITDEHVARIEKLLEAKERDIMTV